MAYLDVSDAILDPMLASRFTVRRRSEAVDGFGISRQTFQRIQNIVGVVCDASPGDLRRLPEDQWMARHISVVTRYRLIGPAPGMQPDVIEWQGSDYVVKLLGPYAQFGAGFVQAIAGSMTTIDPPTP